MADHDPRASLHMQVRVGYDSMPPAERRLADLILNFPGELAGYSASELARMAETSGAAVTRFVRRLGFASYEDMRRRAREEKEAGSPLYLIDHSFGSAPGEPPEARADRFAKGFVDNLQATFGAMDYDTLARLADRVSTAGRTFIVGFRHGFYLAGYLRWSLAHARADVHLLPRDGETLGESMVDISPGDMVIVFAFRRRVAAVNRIIAVARSAGAAVALICDPSMIDTGGAEWVIRCQSRGTGPIDDHGPALAYSHVLTQLVLARDPARSRKRLAHIDAIHDDLTELS
jgi:DNA-binding MurR/RpiR family transcriptional regulator